MGLTNVAIFAIVGVVIAAVVGVFAIPYKTSSPPDSALTPPKDDKESGTTGAVNGVDYERQYRDGALQVGRTITNGSLAIAVLQVGNYFYDGYGIYFRVDMRIENTGNETTRVPQYYYVTDEDGRQYKGETQNFSNDKVLTLADKVAPGQTIEKYKLFPMLPSSVRPTKLLMVDPASPTDFVWSFDLS
jgi:hypothetical protein